MRVVLSTDIFLPEKADDLALLALFSVGAQGRHSIQLEDLDSPVVASWISSQKVTLQEQCEFALQLGLELDATNPSSYTIRVSSLSASSWGGSVPTLTINDAVTFLHRSFTLLVEDITREQNFLLAVATGNRQDLLKSYISKRWISFEHGAGVTRMRERVKELRLQRSETFLYFVMYDSDSLRPAVPHSNIVKLERACEKHFPYHRLSRRMIENYIPIDSLAEWSSANPGKKGTVRAISRLSDVQRYHYNFKRGFAGDSARLDIAVVGNLYDDVSSPDRISLNPGLGDHIAQIFEKPISQAYLVRDGSVAEFNGIIDRVLSFI